MNIRRTQIIGISLGNLTFSIVIMQIIYRVIYTTNLYKIRNLYNVKVFLKKLNLKIQVLTICQNITHVFYSGQTQTWAQCSYKCIECHYFYTWFATNNIETLYFFLQITTHFRET